MYTTLIGKHIASVYYLTCVYSKDLNLDSAIQAIDFWDENRLSFIVHPLKKRWVKIFGLKSLIQLERYLH